MKLLFDHNLSHKLCRRLLDLFPDSIQTRALSFGTARDEIIWEYAKTNGFNIVSLDVSLDKDFSNLALLRGAPPKIIWMRRGNSTVAEIERFDLSSYASVLENWP